MEDKKFINYARRQYIERSSYGHSTYGSGDNGRELMVKKYVEETDDNTAVDVLLSTIDKMKAAGYEVADTSFRIAFAKKLDDKNDVVQVCTIND